MPTFFEIVLETKLGSQIFENSIAGIFYQVISGK